MCERWFGSLDAPRGDFLGIRAGIKTARKEAASAKQCIKGKYSSRWENKLVPGGGAGARLLWDWVFWGLSGFSSCDMQRGGP